MKRAAFVLAAGFACLTAARRHRRKSRARSIYDDCLMCELWERP